VFDLMRKYVEKGMPLEAIKEPTRGTDTTKSVHNYDNRSERYIIPHSELFLGHFNPGPRRRRAEVAIDADNVLGNFQERFTGLTEQDTVAEADRCMSCGMCFECDNCVIYCPQTAVYRVKKGQTAVGRYVDTDYTKCIGCHICADVCPTGYIQMGLGEQ
ncbi:MAG: 4Fe-4S dicluster domain-containing protein, partial [Rhodospirillales bacterium]|nr:4Fe-4S dicluster domain-containing protein [Rhodospirillales bacterium]